jgi:Mpv17 / PMP22 family
MLQIWATVAEKTLPTVAANYVIWPAAHIISFRYVPSQQRILYNNSVAIFWNCYLSLVAADNGSASGSGPGWSWDAYAFWTGLPGGLVVDPGVSRTVSEMYQSIQGVLGIHPDPVGTSVFASDVSKMYHELQSGLHSPETVTGLARLSSKVSQLYHEVQTAVAVHIPNSVPGLAGHVVPRLKPVASAAAIAPHEEGLATQLHSIAEAASKGAEVVQGGMHESMLVAGYWLKSVLQVCTRPLLSQALEFELSRKCSDGPLCMNHQHCFCQLSFRTTS